MRTGTRLATLAILILPCLALTAQPDADSEENPLWPYREKPPATDETCLKLMELNLQARGGREALESVNSVRFTGTLIEGKTDYTYTVLHSPPASVRIERYRYHIGRHYRVFWGIKDGSAWTMQAEPEKELPVKIDGLEKDLLDFQARLPFLFLNAEKDGHLFAYSGEARYAGRQAYVMHGWLASGMRIDIHIDADSFHVINYRVPYQLGGHTFIVDHTPARLMRAEGAWWEVAYRTHVSGKTFRQQLFNAVECNVPLEEGAFSEPPVKEFWLRGPGASPD